MAKSLAMCVITAVRTDDGAPTYMGPDGQWSNMLKAAQVYDSEGAAAEALALACRQERQVCDPYLMPVAVQEGQVVPTTARERIRATGPTSRLRRPDPLTP